LCLATDWSPAVWMVNTAFFLPGQLRLQGNLDC
jgi:hypothetical protein